MSDLPHFDLVVLAASAGGVGAVGTVLGGLWPDFPVPVAVVQHRTTHSPNLLTEVLQRRTALRVKLVDPGERMRPGTVYVAWPHLHLLVQPDGTLACRGGIKIQHVRSSANPMLSSAAEVFHGRLIGVVLTGYGEDATEGVQAVRAHGGIVIAQDRETSLNWGMPSAAIRSGAVCHTLPLDRIAPALLELVTTGGLRDGEPAHPSGVSGYPGTQRGP
jgi:two-component system, chemotaxis family, protein-glutamate methylesterase/glutaminase